jgi:N-methylhydantoinase A
MLAAASARELSQSYLKLLGEADINDIEKHFESLESRARSELSAEGNSVESITIERTVDCRYRGQSFTLNLPWFGTEETLSKFHQLHLSTYGHNFELGVDLVNIRISARVQKQPIELPTSNQQEITGEPVNKEIWTRTGQSELEEVQTPLLHREQMPIDQWQKGPILICETSATIWVDPLWQCKKDSYGNLLLEKID